MRRSFMPLRGKTRGLLVLTAVSAALALASAGSAADLTLTKEFLDEHDGFIDFKQIPHTLQPGDSVLIEGHTRPSLSLVNLVYGGPAEGRITVTNVGPNPFVIDDVGPAANDGLKIWGAQHVTLKGTPVGNDLYGIKVLKAGSVCVDVDYNNYQQGRVAGEFEDTKDLEIANVELANCGFAGIQAKYEKLSSALPPTALLDGLHIHDTRIYDTAGEGMYIGWTSNGHPDVANVSIHHNRIERAGWDGIQLNRSQGVNAIHDNVVDGYAVRAIEAPNSAFAAQNEGISVSGSVVTIYNNVVTASNQYSGSGLFFAVYDDVARVYNNVFVHGGFGSSKREAALYIKQENDGSRIAATPDASLEILNNTIVKPDSHGIELLGGVTRPVSIINNVIAEPLNGGEDIHVQNRQNPPMQTTNRTFETVAAAGFQAADDYRPAAGSPLIDSGTNVASRGVTTDIEGVGRPQGEAYDVGAYEGSSSTGETVVTPIQWGTAAGSPFCPAAGAFDAQPSWTSGATEPSGEQPDPNASTTTAYADRHWYVDFGPHWAKVRLTGMWTRYRPWSGGSYAGFVERWWDDDNDNVHDGTSAAGLNFATAQGLPHVNAQQWVRDRDFSSPVTPAGRYLVFATGPAPTQRANEFVFIGYRVP